MTDTNTNPIRVSVSTAALATLTTGIVMVEGFAGVGEAAEAVTGHPVWTHEMSAAAARAREVIPAQLPGFPVEATAENWREVLASTITRFGETVEIDRGTDTRTATPFATLADMIGEARS